MLCTTEQGRLEDVSNQIYENTVDLIKMMRFIEAGSNLMSATPLSRPEKSYRFYTLIHSAHNAFMAPGGQSSGGDKCAEQIPVWKTPPLINIV